MKSNRWDSYFMDVAFRTAGLSYARRSKVGAVAVREKRIIACGYNGTPEYDSNRCEDIEPLPAQRWPETLADQLTLQREGYDFYGMDIGWARLTTLPTVIHAEANLIFFAKKHDINLDFATLYVTHSPCYDCAGIILPTGISEVVYSGEYRLPDGLERLKSGNVKTRRYQNEL
jgi:dCMP deaminase